MISSCDDKRHERQNKGENNEWWTDDALLTLLSLFLSNSSPSRAFSSPPQATSELKRKLADVKRKLEKVEVERKACGVSFTLMNNSLSIIRPFTAESTAVIVLVETIW